MRGAGGWVAIVVCAAAAACGSATGAGGPGNGDELGGRLVLTGSSTVAPLAAEIGRRFEQLHPGVRVDVQAGGSARGLADARTGLADIGMVSRALHEEEHDLTPYLVALDGLAIIVHRDNPVAALSSEQIRRIYRGQVRDWAQVGGAPGTIVVVSKAQGRSTLEIFLQHFGLAAEQIRADVVIGDNQQGIKTVAGAPGAIGYVSIGAADSAIAEGTPLRMVALDGVQPSVQGVADGSYPVLRELNLVTRGPARGLAARFIDFATSPAVDDLIARLFFVPPSR